jgi:hypothetical protein
MDERRGCGLLAGSISQQSTLIIQQLWMVKNHFFDFDAFDGIELVHQFGCVSGIVSHFQQEQAVRRAKALVGFVQTQPYSVSRC